MAAPIFADAPRIPRLDAIHPDQLASEYVRPRRPVIFGEGFRDWEVLGNWTPQRLATRFPTLKVVDEHIGKSIEFADFVARIEAGEPRWGRLYFLDRYPELHADIGSDPPCLESSWIHGRYLPRVYGLKRRIRRQARPELLIGGAGSYFPCYHHEHSFCHCFLFQVYGRKNVVLFEPEAGPGLYPDREHPNKSTLSPVDDPDPAEYPLFAQQRYEVATLEPGDTLFSPAGWWLGLQNPEISMTVRRHYVEQGNWNAFRGEFLADRRTHAGLLRVALDTAAIRVLSAVYPRWLR